MGICPAGVMYLYEYCDVSVSWRDAVMDVVFEVHGSTIYACWCKCKSCQLTKVRLHVMFHLVTGTLRTHYIQ